MKKVFLAFALLMSLACSAQTFSCPPLLVSGDDGSGYLQIEQSTCTFISSVSTTGQYVASITLTHAATINIVDAYHDATSGIWVLHSYLEVATPAGKVNRFTLYEDRNPGGPVQPFNTWPNRSILLPAGSIVEYSVQVFTHTLSDCATGCALNSSWHLNSDF